MSREHRPLEPSIQVPGPEAAGSLANLHARCFADPWSTDDVARLLAASTTLALTAHGKGIDAPIGLLLLQCVEDEAEVLSLAVDPSWRRSGLGTMLLARCLDRLRSRQVTRLLLEVADDNPSALALYLRSGFREIHRRRGYYARPGARPVDAIVMDLDV
jgi:ribosomal-protein-alanine N-acetyltransferase